MSSGERDLVCQTCKNTRVQSKRVKTESGKTMRLTHPCSVCRKSEYRAWLKDHK